jgi:hypothetical protein
MTRPRLEVAEVIRSGRDAFLERYGARLTPEPRRALNDLTACRTAAGGRPECLEWHRDVSDNSCGHRPAPSARPIPRAVAGGPGRPAGDNVLPRRVLLLPRPAGAATPAVYGCSCGRPRTPPEVAGTRNTSGPKSVSWRCCTPSQSLGVHPHVHCVTSGGHARRSRWVAGRDDFFCRSGSSAGCSAASSRRPAPSGGDAPPCRLAR